MSGAGRAARQRAGTDAAGVGAARRRPRWARRAVPLALVALALGCAEPDVSEPPPPAEDEQAEPPTADVLDPTTDALRAQLESLRTLVAGARDQLTAAAEADTAGTAARSAQAALALLLAEPDANRDPALFPAVTAERGAVEETTDVLTATLTLARDAGGDLGRATVEALRDPVAGDLGAWERDAEGMVATARATTTTGRPLAAAVDEVTAEVLLLEGDGTRALAWTLAAAEADTLEDVRTAAARAGSHLGVVLVALDLLLDGRPDTDPDGSS